MLSTSMPSSHLDAFTLDIANADGLALPVLGGAVKPSTLWVSAPSRIVRLQEGLNCIEVNAMGVISNSLTSAFTSSSIRLYGITVLNGNITNIADYRTQDARLNANDVAVLKATVPLTSQQISELPAGLTALVAAPGPGVIRHFRGAMIVVKIAAAPYSGISVSSKLYVEYAGQGQPLGAALNVDGVNLLLGTVYPDDTRTYVATIEPQNFAVVNGTDVIPSANVSVSDNFENLGFRLRMENGSTDPLGGGDPANGGVVTVIYTDVEIPE